MHGITIDGKDNVWLAGNAGHTVLKFSKDGKFLLQIGKNGASKGTSDTANLSRPAEVEVDLADSITTWRMSASANSKLPGIHRHHQPYLPLYPLAWGGLDLSAVDVILSNKSGFCHGLQHNALHICYCLAPTRYVWQIEPIKPSTLMLNIHPDWAAFGIETGEPARLVGVFHPVGSELTAAEATRSRISAFGIEYEGKSGLSTSEFSWAA